MPMPTARDFTGPKIIRHVRGKGLRRIRPNPQVLPPPAVLKLKLEPWLAKWTEPCHIHASVLGVCTARAIHMDMVYTRGIGEFMVVPLIDSLWDTHKAFLAISRLQAEDWVTQARVSVRR